MIVERDIRPLRMAATISLCLMVASTLLGYVLVNEIGAVVLGGSDL